ncbi:hypothetical protein [Rathayibacter rathayi]|uniref:hypothetical protein n=1 Tax=Rathayibacter rathayi TaxID=33887 RepID=UPI000CE7C344|nr:hypothetical protein [Rathayibacter rathayi]PPG93001.1 hypothetical protein C5C22_12155 [Rathayibacter rathayi]
MNPASTPHWGAPSSRTPPSVPLPARVRFEPTALLGSMLRVGALPATLRSRVRQAAPERQRRLVALADVAEGFVVLHTRELTRALRRIAAPAAAAPGDAASVLAVGRDGVELAAERADGLRIAEWERVVSVGVGTSPAGARRVRAVVLAVLAPGSVPAGSAAARAVAEALAARRRPRTVLIPLVVASPGPLGWRVADDRAFLLALDRLRRALGERA